MAQVRVPAPSSQATTWRPPFATQDPLSIARAQSVRPGLRVAEGRGVSITLVEDFTLFLLVSVVTGGIGLWAAMGLTLFHLDAVARTHAAAQVFYGFDPKLANIGFIWAPIPTLLQFPLVLIAPKLAYASGVSPVLSAMAAGVCVMLLNRILSLYVPRRLYRYLLLVAYQANPLVFTLAIAGLSELILLAFVLLAWLAFQRLTFEEPLPFVQIAVMGGAIAGAVLTRYEGFMFALALGAMFVATMYLQKRAEQWHFTEGLAVAYVTPWAYAFAVWVFFNAMIMGNPLYFITGKGSAHDHAASLLASNAVLADLVGNIPGSTLHTIRAAWDVSPAYVIMAPLSLLIAVVRRDLFLLSLVFCSFSFPMMQLLLYWRGESLGWLRYHVYIAPIGVMLVGYVLRRLFYARSGWMRQGAVAFVIIAMFGWSNVMTWRGLQDPNVVWGGETDYLKAIFLGKDGGLDEFPRFGLSVAEYIRDELVPSDPNTLILMDDQQANDIVLLSGHPGRFVVPNSAMFFSYVLEPVGKVSYFLVPESASIGTDFIQQTYPRIYEEGAPFATLVKDLKTPKLNWRLYRIHEPPPELPQQMPVFIPSGPVRDR